METIMSKMKNGNAVIGPFVKSPDPAIVELIALSGFDFVIIDCEHGPLDMLTTQNLIRAAESRGLTAIVRVSENNPSLISRALDIGAAGVQVPQISCKVDAEDVVKASKFSPIGERGVCRFVRAADYSGKERNSYFESANDKTMIIIHIEGKEGVENIDEILEVDEIDVIFIGPYDLSQSVGLPGQVDHPDVEDLMKSVVNKALKKGKAVGTFVDNDFAAKKWRAHGVKYISYSVDMGMIYDKFKEVVDHFNDE